MGNYGNNVTALVTGGTLVYVDEQASVDMAETSFEQITMTGRDFLLDHLAVDGIYRPGILNRAIKAMPKYATDDATVEPVMRHRSPVLNVKVPNDPANGITAEEFEPGQTISIPPRKGADARAFTLARIVSQNAIWVTFECH